VGKSEGRRQLEKPRCRLQGNIKFYLEETAGDGLDWIHLAQGKDRCLFLVYDNEFSGCTKKNFLTS
jgi:hypothetical protein